MNKKIILCILVAIVFIAISFYRGMSYGKNQIPTQNLDRFNGGQFSGNMNGRNRVGMGGFSGGEIISKDNKSITVKSTDGGSRIIFFDSNTIVSKMVAGTLNDLPVGTNVSVNGTSNPDGSITAKSIQIRPADRQKTQAGQ